MRVLLLSAMLCGWVCVITKVPLSRRYIISSLAGMLLILVLLVGVKYKSSLGRLHIWYIDMQLLQQQSWWKGVGHHGFNVSYNHAQARYFAPLSLDSSRAMLANDGYYAFNEFIQLAIEYGWWAGLALLLGFVAFIHEQCRLIRYRVPMISTRFIAAQLLWPIVIGCWVGYPLHKWYGPAVTIGLASCIVVDRTIKYSVLRIGLVLSIVIITVAYLFVIRVQTKKEVENLIGARELWQIGHKQEAMQQMQLYCNGHPLAIPHHETLAAWYWLCGKDSAAVQMLEAHHKVHCNQRLHQQLGYWYALQNNKRQASFHLHTSLYITHICSRAGHIWQIFTIVLAKWIPLPIGHMRLFAILPK